jgi:hypothetical protein
MWKFKTNRRGELTPAVKRRIGVYKKVADEIDLENRDERIMFGTCYLEYIS